MRRMARNCIANAHRMLSAQTLSDNNVHEARKEIKKSRAAVRLLRTALGSARFQRENARLRDAARALNGVRDARVLVNTLDSLRERRPRMGEDATFLALSGQLRESQRLARHQLRKPAPQLIAARRILEQTAYSAAQWPVGVGGWNKLGPSFRRIYGAGRRAARRARAKPDDHLLHEWRKEVKYLVQALHFFEPLRRSKLSRHAKLAQRLADELGDAHDLALLRACVVTQSRRQGVQAKSLLGTIDRRRGILRRKSLALIERVYPDPPHVVDQRLQHYWHRWCEHAN